MTAYNFHKQFVGGIFRGAKTQTIRRCGKRRHAKRGEKLQLYFAQRTQHCRKILIDDPTCISVQRLSIEVADFDVGREATIKSLRVGERKIPEGEFNSFAESDGFLNANDMAAYWIETRGVGFFDDYLFIRWTPPAVPKRPKVCPKVGSQCRCCNPRCLCGCRLKCAQYFDHYWDYSLRRSMRLRSIAKGGAK
jgi:hypothetical protein